MGWREESRGKGKLWCASFDWPPLVEYRGEKVSIRGKVIRLRLYAEAARSIAPHLSPPPPPPDGVVGDVVDPRRLRRQVRPSFVGKTACAYPCCRRPLLMCVRIIFASDNVSSRTLFAAVFVNLCGWWCQSGFLSSPHSFVS